VVGREWWVVDEWWRSTYLGAHGAETRVELVEVSEHVVGGLCPKVVDVGSVNATVAGGVPRHEASTSQRLGDRGPIAAATATTPTTIATTATTTPSIAVRWSVDKEVSLFPHAVVQPLKVL